MDSDYHDNDEGTYYGLDPFDPVAEEGNPLPVVEKIRSGEIRSEPNLFDYDRDRSASAAINMLVELLQNRDTTVASEFLFYVSSRNFDFCKKLVGLLEDKSKPKGGSRVSEDELLATQRHFEDPAIGHLSATRRREIAGRPDNIGPDAVRLRLRRAKPLLNLHAIKAAAVKAELDEDSPDWQESDPNEPPFLDVLLKRARKPENG